MAFVSRTTRDAAPMGASRKSTGKHVGPGSYDAPSAFRKTAPAYVGFSSSTMRKQAGDSDTLRTPGPGSYARAAPGMGVKWASSIATPFLSYSDRFPPKAVADVPGPGAYGAPGASVGGAGKDGARGRKGLADAAPPVTWVRVPTAPSIPAPNQSYGYEEGAYGELVLQKGPGHGHSGRPGDAIGPGQYQPKLDYQSGRKTTMVDFSKSRSKRTDFASRTTAAVDPGAYHRPDVDTKKWVKGGDAKSSVFASGVSRPAPGKGNKKVDRTPGPGAYRVPTSFKTRPVAERQQFFGSTSRRFTSSKKDLGPGPGKYSAPSAFKKALSGAPASAIRTGVGFTSTANRFRPKDEDETPGPGAHNLDSIATRADRQREAAASRAGVFGSTTKRFWTPADKVERPGPGRYRHEALMSKRTYQSAAKPSAVFASTDTRFKAAPVAEHPEPGAYNVDPGWVRSSNRRDGSGLMASGPQRFTRKSAADTPGPGFYEKEARAPVASPPGYKTAGDVKKSLVMVSTAPRFAERVPDPAPGPGAYDHDHLRALSKRTFNMTIAEEERGWHG